MKRKAEGDTNSATEKLSEEEAALYDRQIRLWGADAQQRMREAHVLIYGFGGIHAEVCKNVVLAGIGAVTIMDEAIVEPQHLSAQFFLRQDDVKKEVRIFTLNSWFFSLHIIPSTTASKSCVRARTRDESKGPSIL